MDGLTQASDQASAAAGLPDVGESTKRERPPESQLTRCPRCGMDKAGWTGNDARGYDFQGQTYCCEGCAKNTGCTCTSEMERHTGQNIGQER
jgi:hypothetical protein